ncbi:unnamed protein product [Cylicocyclus nassatus]|uniref:Helitron helicase-like domain-containing protein n=1 Tax=Cylicocyclus nassatus TaxID=53992 RepID=A0AA36H2J4_CYLNA|nr:unnamed protein product [Cylicocyclus nassatus]
MPHAHLLVTLANKVDTPEKIDSIISAELPDYPKRDDPERERKLRLFELVRKHMIHGPCSERPELGCRDANGANCSKGYPKPYRNFTELCSGGYPLYRRRDDGPDSVVLELLHNDDLMKKNVYLNEKKEKCLNLDMREVYRLARYVSHMEAAYRILRYPMHYTMHTVITLIPHLPNEEPIYFTSTAKPPKRKKSKLLAYFDLVKEDDRARNMTWVEVAENYRFTGTKYVPYKRKGLRIARLSLVNPKMLELYALRKLLLYKKGVQSFEHLRTHRGKVYKSFMEAAQAAGYIEKTTEWEDCLRSASATDMPS